MLKKVYGSFLLIIFVSIASCSSEKKDNKNEGNKEKSFCQQYKNGKFLFRIKLKEGDKTLSIKRNDSIQTETDIKTGYYTKSSVKWTDECNYELLMLETTFSFPDSIQNIRRTIPLKTEILSSTDDYYVFRSKRDNSDFVMTDTMWVEK